MSDVRRFDPFDEHSGMEKSHDGLYVLASDYDRDTQALLRRVEWLEEGRKLLLLSRDHCATLTPPISDWFAREPR